MNVLQLAVLALVTASGTAVVLTREADKQVIGVSFFGLMLALMFFVFQAPDVALSQIVIGTVGLPLMVLLAIAKSRQDTDQRQQSEHAREKDEQPAEKTAEDSPEQPAEDPDDRSAQQPAEKGAS